MKKQWIFALGGGLFLAFVSLMVYGLYFASDPKEIPSNLIGTKASNFHVITFDGQTVDLKNYRGKPVILNFWASWCVSCRQEAHIVETAYQAFKDQGAVFIGLAINDERSASLRFIEKYGKTYLLGPDDTIGTISLNYGVTAVPETFFIDKEGIIRYKSLGPVASGQIDRFLEQQLQGDPPVAASQTAGNDQQP